jgi:translation elongation factor P/translation initiation factor 5A
MQKIIGVVAGFAFMAGVSAAALAEEMQATVVSYDQDAKTLTLDNGETYTVGDIADLQLHEGDTVKEQDGEMVVTEIENVEGGEMESGAEAQDETTPQK